MAVRKVLGIETEYGIHVKAPNSNPTAASSLLINAYVNGLASKVNWDFDDEAPHRDARGFLHNGGMAPIVDSHLFNTVLTNGARYYVDHAHPEYSSPECSTVLEALTFDRAGEIILQRSMEAASKLLPPGEEIVIYKNNSDGKGNSYGCHENYLVARHIPFAQIARDFTPFLVTRQLFTGSGKVGCEEEGTKRSGFEITQRADFFEEEVGLETTMRRPIINSRDEPHADANTYRRLHVITGDANLAEVANFLKMGTSALMLSMIEDGIFDSGDLALASPVRAMHDVSHDLTLGMKLELADGVTVTALELQWEIFELARAYAESHSLEPLGPPEVGALVLEHWERVLNGLEHDPASLKGQLDWVAKYELIQAFCDRHDCTVDDPRISALDLQYHDLRPGKSLFARLGTERVVEQTAVLDAVSTPPQTTRAFFRGECLRHFPDSIVAANWDSIIFDTGEAALRRIPMMDPLRGSAAHVGTLFDECNSPAELIARLEG
jgi:proteasome accessory factor A